MLNTSKLELLHQLNSETFILDLKDYLPDLPKFDEFNVRRGEDCSIEVEVQKGTVLNDLFSLLNQAGIEVISMRTKANRLEELFLSIVDNGREQ